MYEGRPKNSQNCKKVCIKYSYKFETLVPFKILPLWLDAVNPVQIPLLETMSKTFNGKAVKGCQWFSLNLCNISKMPPFQILIHPWEQKKRSKKQGQASGGGHNHHCFFSQKWGVLPTLQRFNKNRWQSLRRFLLKILDNVSKQWEQHWDRCIQVTGGVLWRWLKFQTCFQTCTNNFNKFFNNSGNFWVPPHIYS